MGITEKLYELRERYSRKRRGTASGAEILAVVFGLGISMLIAVAFLPSALTSWYDATQPAGSLANMSTDFKTIWNMAPILVVLAIIAVIVGLVMAQLKKATD